MNFFNNEKTISRFNPTGRFGNRVENYAKYRPDYPGEVLSFITEKFRKRKKYKIADIGSGTGIFSRLLLETGQTVYGVEPNPEMRIYAEEHFKDSKNFSSIDGTAEDTKLDNNNIDLITSAQAFHWFELTETKKEFLRIAKVNGSLLLIWNDRKTDTDSFAYEYEKLLRTECPEYSEVMHNNLTDNMIEKFYTPFKTEKRIFRNEQEFDFHGLFGRVKSSSYIPVYNKRKMSNITTLLNKIFDKYNMNGKVKFVYDTTVYFGRIK